MYLDYLFVLNYKDNKNKEDFKKQLLNALNNFSNCPLDKECIYFLKYLL